jgi:hypothetical protein
MFFSTVCTGLESAIDLILYKQLPNEKFLSDNGEIPSQTAIYNPFSGKLYFREGRYFRKAGI